MPAFSVWRGCRHKISIGFGGAVYQPIDGIEIESTCRAHQIEFDAGLLRRVRQLDDAWLAEQAQIMKESAS